MYKINTNYQKLPGSYLFQQHCEEGQRYSRRPILTQDIIRLGIGDVTQPHRSGHH